MACRVQIVTFITVFTISLSEEFTKDEFLIAIDKSINDCIIISLIEISCWNIMEGSSIHVWVITSAKSMNSFNLLMVLIQNDHVLFLAIVSSLIESEKVWVIPLIWHETFRCTLIKLIISWYKPAIIGILHIHKHVLELIDRLLTKLLLSILVQA